MNRETLTAIFLGFAGGILVALLLITIPKRLPQAKKQPTPTPSQQTVIEEKTKMNIESPENNAYIEGESIDVIGSTKGKSKIVVNGPIEDKVTTAGDDGKFKTTIGLADGENNISVSAYFEDDSVVTKSLTIFVSKEAL